MNLSEMKKEQLIEYAAQKGYKLDPSLNVAKMREAIEKIEQAQFDDAKTQTEDSARRYAKAHGESLMQVKFTNMQDQGADIFFTLDANRKKPFRFHLYDGQVYKLPPGVIDHINSTTYPVSQKMQEPGTGEIQTRTIHRNRANCIPIRAMQSA